VKNLAGGESLASQASDDDNQPEFMLRTLKTWQKLVTIASMLMPLCLFIFLFLINRDYEGQFFSPSFLGPGMLVFCLIWMALGSSLLLFAFRRINLYAQTKPEKKWVRRTLSLLSIVAFLIVFLIPALLIVFLGPAFLMLVEESMPS
jgi:hypothetical protein